MRIGFGLVVAMVVWPLGISAAEPEQFARLMRNCAMGHCENAVRSLLNANDAGNRSGDEISEELGLVALVVFDVARGSDDPDVWRRAAGALHLVANRAEDAEQETAIRLVAIAIETGDISLFDVADPFSVSPY